MKTIIYTAKNVSISRNDIKIKLVLRYIFIKVTKLLDVKISSLFIIYVYIFKRYTHTQIYVL